MIGIDFSGKTAIITGSSQGLGETTARVFHQAGANVVVNYFADPQGINKALADKVVESLGDRAMVFEADVRDESAVVDMVGATVDRFGSLHYVVNNAGIIRDKTLKKMTRSDWDIVVDTNLVGVFNVCKAAVDRMEDGGSIVNLSSISAFVGFFGQANYAAAKAGVAALSKVLSKEVARRRITVNAIAPGVVLTEMGKSIPEDVRAGMLANVALGRFGESAEIANVALFLCSDLASYITGQVIHVNGGWIS